MMYEHVSVVQADSLERVGRSLAGIGYSGKLLHSDYTYSDVFDDAQPIRTVPLAGFAQDPPSYRNACVGVVLSNGLAGAPLVSLHRALGAPLVFEITPETIRRWKVTRTGDPQLLDQITPTQVERAFDQNRGSWGPREVFAAKTTSVQLDFVDAGLMPVLEGMVRGKLDGLLKRTVKGVTAAYEEVAREKPDPKEMFRLLFRFVTAKVLRDRRHQGPWDSDNAEEVLRAIEGFYQRGHEALPAAARPSPRVLAEAWSSISSAFHFQNLSADDLAFVYENTFVTAQTRKTYGTHSTPPHIAEYIVRKLPFETLPEGGRRVFEPCAGHGVFLVSAMRRLRELLAPGVANEVRHEYLRERLVGIELDPFAREVCLLTLLLADYPNPNGWQLHLEDAFSTPVFQSALECADVVLCNPPFGAFSAEEQERYGPLVSHDDKASEVLARVLTNPPDLLGFVLPRVAATGATYQKHRHQLARHYGTVESVALPDHVFTHSEHETVILMAWDRRAVNRQVHVTSRLVRKTTYAEFRDQGVEPPAEVAVRAVPETAADPLSLWVPVLSRLWEHLEGALQLRAVADTVRGVEWLTGPDVGESLSKAWREGWQRAFTSAEEGIGQYRFGVVQFVDPEQVRKHRRRHDWSEPKVVATKHAVSRGPWRLAAAADHKGALITQEFYAVHSFGSVVAPEVIAALLNGPVANAWLFAREDKRDNRWETFASIPIPPLDRLDQELIADKVKQLERLLAGDAGTLASPEDLARLLLQIDAAVLQAYALPPDLEQQLFDLFQDVERPVGLQFTGYNESFAAEQAAVLEEQYDRRSERYQELVDRKYVRGLTVAEANEMQRLGQWIDDYHAPYYEGILAELRAQAAQGRPSN